MNFFTTNKQKLVKDRSEKMSPLLEIPALFSPNSVQSSINDIKWIAIAVAIAVVALLLFVG